MSQWIPGQTIQFLVETLTERAYTPMDLDPPTGRGKFLFFRHGQGPASEWAAALQEGNLCKLMQENSIDFTRERALCCSLGMTSFAAAQALQHCRRQQEPFQLIGTPPLLFRLLNQQKYPASQLFLLMTLGPTIALLGLVERAGGWFSDALETIGRVPMFYYLLHVPLIHIAALFVVFVREGRLHSEWYTSAPFTFLPRSTDSRFRCRLLKRAHGGFTKHHKSTVLY